MKDAHNHPAISIQNAAKFFSKGLGVFDVSMVAERGRITGLVGVNGAGKSTTLRMITGLITPDVGEIKLFGEFAGPKVRARIGFLPEERGLAPRERAESVIAFHGRLKGMSAKQAFYEAGRLLERVGLGARKRARIEDLSKGNAQRVQILCTLVHNPELLILDEPLSGLDPVAQSEILTLLAEHRARGGSILLSTHSMAAVESTCDSVVMMSQGRTAFQGDVSSARLMAPHGAVVVTPDFEALKQIVAILGGELSLLSESGFGDAARWRIILPSHVPHPTLLRALAEHSVALHAFEPIRQNLEGAFWSIAAHSQAREKRAA